MRRTDLFSFGAVMYEMCDRDIALPGGEHGRHFRGHFESRTGFSRAA